MSRITAISILLLAFTGFFWGGCASATSEKKVAGSMVGDETLKRVVPGSTTKEWLITTLGVPTSSEIPSKGGEILKYEWCREENNSLSVPFLNTAQETIKARNTVFFEIENGVVKRFWKETPKVEKTSKL